MNNKPLVIYLFDIYKGNNFPFPGNMLANIFEPLIFKSATNIIVTNEGTRDFYIKRYGDKLSEKIVIIHNSAFKENYLNIDYISEIKSEYTIVFTGSIYWPQIGALKNLIRAVEEINNINIKIKIYTPSPKDYLKEIGIEESEKVEISVASPKEISAIQNKADILFLPLSWYTESQAIVDTATPGKLTDYLIAGKPILIHAPSSSFLVKYAKEKNFALVIDKEDIKQLKFGIKKLLTEPLYVKKLIENSQNTFFENHDANKNSKKFYNLLINIK